MHNILFYIVHYLQLSQITQSSSLMLTTCMFLDWTAAVLPALGRILHSQGIQGLLTPHTAAVQPLTTCQCLWKPALKGWFGLTVSRLLCHRTRNVVDIKCQPPPCPTPACPHLQEELSSDALQRTLSYLLIISLKFYAYATAAWFKTLVYWLPTRGGGFCFPWFQYPSWKLITKASWQPFHCSSIFISAVHTTNVLKFNSFSLIKKKSPRKTGAVCN